MSGALVVGRYVLRREGEQVTIEGPFGEVMLVTVERFEAEVLRLAFRYGVAVRPMVAAGKGAE